MALRTRWKNWKLRRYRSKLEKEYDRAAEEAKQKKDEDILTEWYGINGWEFAVTDAEIKQNVSRDVLDQAEDPRRSRIMPRWSRSMPCTTIWTHP